MRIKRKRALVVTCLVLALVFMLWQAGWGAVDSKPVLSWALAGKTVLIDPGHGGDDPGVVSSDGVREKEVNLAIAQDLAEILRQAGANVVLTRENDNVLSRSKREDLDQRLALMKDSGSCVCVSVHGNSFPQQPAVHGAQVFYNRQDINGQQLAEQIQSYVNQLSGCDRTALAHPSAYLLHHNQIPTALVEVGFFSNSQEMANLQSEEYRWQMAWAIYNGIVAYFVS